MSLYLIYMGCVLDESGTDGSQCNMNLRVVGMLQAPIGPWLMLGIWQLDYGRVLHETLFVPVLM